MTTLDNTYKLPMVVVAALSTGRPEMIPTSLFLDKQEQGEILRLLADLITERRVEKDKADLLKYVAQQTLQNIEGATARLHRAFDAASNLCTKEEMEDAIRGPE